LKVHVVGLVLVPMVNAILTYSLSRIVSKLLQIIGQICAFDGDTCL